MLSLARNRNFLQICGTLTFASAYLFALAVSAQEVGQIAGIGAVRAQSNGSVHIFPKTTLSGSCTDRVFATLNKAENEKILSVALAALLSRNLTKIQYNTSNCQLTFIEIREN